MYITYIGSIGSNARDIICINVISFTMNVLLKKL